MADYASAIVGIVAFGLGVCKGLLEYYNSFKHQDGNIAKVLSDARVLQDLLLHVKNLLQNEQNTDLRKGIDQSIWDIVSACSKVLEELDTELQKVRCTRVGKDNSITESLVRGVRRLKYPFKESTLLKLIESIGEVRDNLSVAFEIRHSISLDILSHSLNEVREVVQQLQKCQSNIEALKWLHAPDASADLYIAADKRHEGTGLWLLDSNNASSKKYRDWLQSKNKTFLWLVGFAGTGKSVLASSIIRDVAKTLPTKSALVFFFFNFRDQSKQSSMGLLRSLVQQLCGQTSSDLLEQFHNDNQHHQPSRSALSQLVGNLVSEFEHVYMVVDAVDECPVGSDRDEVIAVLNKIKAMSNIHLLVTSREANDIRQGLQATDYVSISLNNSEVQTDIELFVREHLINSKRLMKWQKHHTDIEHALSKRSQGMFRWVECQFIQLERCRTFNALQKTLRSLPLTLNETYDRVVAGIDQDSKTEVLRALAFLCFSTGPMLVCELIDAMAVQSDNSQAFDTGDRIEDIDDLFNLLPGLLSLTFSTTGKYMSRYSVITASDGASLSDRKHHKIHFAHASVKDYFLSGEMTPNLKDFHMTKNAADKVIIESSLAYMSSTKKQYSLLKAEGRILDVYPFTRYAAEELADHLNGYDERTNYLSDIMELFRADDYCIETALYLRQERLNVPSGTAMTAHHLNIAKVSPACLTPDLSARQKDLLCATTYLVRTCVVDMAVNTMLNLVSQLKAQGSDTQYLSNLFLWLLSQVASFATANDRNMCRALTGTGFVQYIEKSALCQAMLFRHAYWGDLDTVQKLLPKDVGSMSRLIMNPVNIVELQAKVETATKFPALHDLIAFLQSETASPFSCAVEGQQRAVVKYFLEQDCLVWCRQDQKGQLALDVAMYAASYSPSLEYVKLFLQEGASVTYQDVGRAGFTALHRATLMRELEIMDVLIDRGADVNARTHFGTTPLHFASRKRSPDAARLLLKHGADPKLVNNIGLTCLHCAVLRSRTDTIKFLLAAGADPFRRNAVGLTPRQLLLIHIQKWTNIQDLQQQGPAALRALEEGEKKWLQNHSMSIVNHSPNHEEQKQEPNTSPPIVMYSNDSDLGTSKSHLTDEQTHLDDVVDIFIDVPQILP